MSVVTQSWLEIQCLTLPSVVRAVVLLDDAETGGEVDISAWPRAAADSADLVAGARLELERCRQTARPATPLTFYPQSGALAVSYAFLRRERVTGVFVAEFSGDLEETRESIGRLLDGGALWLKFARQLQLNDSSHDLLNLIKLTIACLEPQGLRHSALAFVNQIKVQLGCSNVALGQSHGGQIVLFALSNSARFDRQSRHAQTLAAAMNEAADQARILAFPSTEDSGSARAITRAHGELAREQGMGALLSVPLVYGNRLVGVLTLARQHEPFTEDAVKLCQFVAMMAGPILELKRENDRGLPTRLADALRRHWERLSGAGHAKYKTLAALTSLGLLLLMVVTGAYRVSADAILEGSIQRVVVSPTDGYIASSAVRPGDMVKQGAILGSLDDKDIKLERLKWTNQLQQHQREYREAMALHDGPKVSILGAQISQAEAQIALLDEKLARIAISAPFDGIVIEGDLSQSLGSPVSRGDVLFKLAPLDNYRLILNVDERNIADIVAGQTGKLVLSSLPGDGFTFTVAKITPVSIAKEGRNYFRVEASLDRQDQHLDSLRPGMKGIGKVEVGLRRLLWLLTHGLIDWLRLWVWAHLP